MMKSKEIVALLRPLLENMPANDNDVILLADGILKNKLYVSPFVPVLVHSGIDSFDWNINEGNTFQLCLHAHVHIAILVCAYSITDNSEYICTADKYFESWQTYINSEHSKRNSLIWNEHCVAMRLLSLLCYFFGRDADLSENAVTIINDHIAFLVDEKNYTPNANHGIFMDRAVICACILLGSHNDSKEIAINRLKKQCEFAYLPDGAHSENSPAYQHYVWTALHALYDFMSKIDSTDGMDFIYECCEKSDDFQAWFIQPDGRFALVGDSDNDNLDATAYNGDGHGDLYNYFLSCGTEGKKPEKNYAFYENAGYYFARNFIDETLKDTWFMFKAGAVTNVHKHADDLSILLSSKGYPVFIDCGRYNYVYGNKIRSYVTGALAHNTVVVDEKTYSVCAQRVDRSKIIETDFNTDYDYIRGRNDGYDGVSIDRAVYRKGDTVVLHDDIISDSDHNYSQHFHLSEFIETVSATDTEFIGRIADSGYVVRITQLEGGTSCDIQNGNEVGVYTGLASCKMGEIHPINTVIFTREKEQNCRFVTEITIEKEAENYSSLSFDSAEMKVSGIVDIQLKQLERNLIPLKVSLGKAEVEMSDENTLKYNINCISDEDYNVHWLVYRDGGAYSYKYTKNESEYTLGLSIPGKYSLVYSVQTSDGDRQTWVYDEIEYPFNVKNYGFSMDKYPVLLKKLDNITAVEIGNQLLHGQLNVWNTMAAEPYHIWDIDWNITTAVSPDSYQMQLQGFRHIMYLTHAFEITKNPKYIDYAWRFLYSWNEYEKSEKSKLNPMCWNDHAMSSRADHIIYLVIICAQYNLLDERRIALTDEILVKSAEHLSNKDFYTPKNNHGIYQDCALLYVAYFLKNEHSEEWITIAKERLRAQFAHAFLPDMVHAENSPEYQIAVIGLFKEVEKIFEYAEDSEYEFYSEKLKDTIKFLTYMIKPNGALAEIGDTDGREDDTVNPNKGYRYLKCDELNWATSLGLIGKKPEGNIAVFPYGGYYIYRSSWEKGQMENSTWFMFKSGYVSRIHKHADDLHFMLNSGGSEIFIDRGKYGYQMGDFTTETLHSALGHNTVIVDGKSYPITSERGYRTGLLKRESQGEFNCTAGYNDSYEGVKIDREIFFKDNVFVIHDNIESDKKHLYTQQFHLSEKLQVLSISDNEMIAKIDDSPLIVRVRQMSACDCEIIGVKDKSAEYGYRSRVFSKLVPCTSLLYQKEGDCVDFITVITLEKNQHDYVEVKLLDNDTVTIGEQQIMLTHRKRISLSDFNISFSGKNLTVSSSTDIPCGTECKITCVDSKWRKVLLDTAEYSVVPNTVFIPFYSECCVSVQIKTPDGYKLKGIVGAFRFNQDTKKFDVVSDEISKYHALYIADSSLKFINKDTIEISADIDYFWHYVVQWYIYKDGQCVKWQGTTNSAKIEYQFTSTGNYYIMIYVVTPDGDRLQKVIGDVKITPEQLA